MKSRDEIIEEAMRFHGGRGPGVAAGVIMVEHALELLGPVHRLGLVVETALCLPDGAMIAARQRHRKCVTTILDHGKFAVTLFDGETGRGVRVWLDHKKTEKYDRLHRWFLRLGPRDEPRAERHARVIEEMKRAGTEVLSSRHVSRPPTPEEGDKLAFCAKCGEPFTMKSEGMTTCADCAKI
jgi:formylmethanofuran dehydrogenase subunit E